MSNLRTVARLTSSLPQIANIFLQNSLNATQSSTASGNFTHKDGP